MHRSKGDGQDFPGEADEQAFGEERVLREAETAEEGRTRGPFPDLPLRRSRQLQRYGMAL